MQSDGDRVAAPLRLAGVSCDLGGRAVLRDVSLSVGTGEIVALLGRSGSGKTTLLHVAAGLIEPSAGSAVVCGNDLTTMTSGRRAEVRRTSIGVVFQFGELVGELSVLENVSLPLRLAGHGRRQAARRSLDLLAALGLDASVAGRRPGEISGGQLQRAAVARALIRTPGVLLCDEPTGALDSVTGSETMALLAASTRERGLATLVVTHSSEVAQMADRVVHLRDGRITGDADSAAPVSSPGSVGG